MAASLGGARVTVSRSLGEDEMFQAVAANDRIDLHAAIVGNREVGLC